MSQEVSSFKGFLQKGEGNKWLLCDAPNLKSCCLDKHTLATLEGDFSTYRNDKVVTVQGIYKDGILSSITIEEQSGSIPLWSLGVVVFIFCLLGARTLSRKL